jgi:hypothetical protein
MHTGGAAYFDDDLFHFEEVVYSVDEGVPGDKDDKYNAVDYADVTRFLVNEFTRPAALPELSYANLWMKYNNLPSIDKDLLEWFESSPPAPKRIDAFFGYYYWRLLHLTILLEKIIDLPPRCSCKPSRCEVCGMTPPEHATVSRGAWLRKELSNRVAEVSLVEQYAGIIEAAKSVRDRMSHRPYFDRSTRPVMVHGETRIYNARHAATEFQEDSVALLALMNNLQNIAHSLLVDRVFAVKHYRPLRSTTSTYITSSGSDA